jgi:hypothetical protein
MKTENLTVAVFPIGSSMKFRKENIKRSDGTSEYYKLIWALVRNKSISSVWLLQRSDWKRLTSEEKIAFDPRGVLRDIYAEFDVQVPPGRRQGPDGNLVPHTQEEQERYRDLWNKVQELPQPDFGVGFASQGLTMVNIPNLIPSIKDPSKMTGSLDMTLIYGAPLVHYLNMSRIPWFMVMTDPRYIKKNQKWRDLVNGPRECIAQYNTDINFTHFDTYPDPTSGKEITETLILKYSGIEKMNLICEEIIRPEAERDVKFSIVAMQSAYGKQEVDYRLEALKKWILNQPGSADYQIYGKWDERFTRQYPQFQGYRTPEEIDEIFKRTKYTFIIPIRPDWVTSKYAEMLRVGVVPFFHPDYDTQYSTLPKDHYLRVKTPQEMFKKIEEMESSPETRIKMVKELQLKFLLGVRKGTFLADTVNPFLERAHIPVALGKEYCDDVIRQADPNDYVAKIAPKKEVITAKSLF